MSEELVTVQQQTLVPAEITGSKDMEAFKEVSTGGAFVPYISLMGTSSELVKEGKFPIGNFALVKDQQHQDIGDNFIALIVAWRAKAMRWGEDVTAVYDQKDPEFNAIKEEANVPNSMGAGYGPEYLMWLPDQQCFATYFLSNPTGRREAGNFHVLLGNTCRVKSRLIKGKKHTWHGPQIAGYNGEITLPNWADVMPIIEAFKNPPKPELAEETEERER